MNNKDTIEELEQQIYVLEFEIERYKEQIAWLRSQISELKGKQNAE